MRIVVGEFISLDGVVQAPGGAEEDTDGAFAHGGWSMPYFDPETLGGFIDEAMQTTDALLFGRRTWQTMAAAWPDRDDGSDPFATRMNTITKYVVSNTLADADLTWANSILVDGNDVVNAVAELKRSQGGDLAVMGSSQLARTLTAAGLVDEYRLMIEPVLLGGGKSVFPMDGERRPLELVSTSTSPTGVVMCVYRPSETPATPDWHG
ncbi:MAG TPA: dihydrofolate reductase family protein [Ilumatobacteraceae bacterium]|nr:dihydrofolate reductase family protein [Ilumatobacteraceae bacterium]